MEHSITISFIGECHIKEPKNLLICTFCKNFENKLICNTMFAICYITKIISIFLLINHPESGFNLLIHSVFKESKTIILISSLVFLQVNILTFYKEFDGILWIWKMSFSSIIIFPTYWVFPFLCQFVLFPI